MHGLSLSSLVLALVALAEAADKHYNLELTTGNVSPDGVTRPAVLINVGGKAITPGPLLTAQKGDDIFVHVTNNLNNRGTQNDPGIHRSTTIHWHGIFQPKQAYDDGPAFITQCPIVPVSPNNTYTYKVETSDQAGTFWYHSHLSSQYTDGLRGALVIYDPRDPLKSLYDADGDTEDTVLSVTDWYHTPSKTLVDDWLNHNGGAPQWDSFLLNGIGLSANPPNVTQVHGQMAVVNVKPGKRYRFRLINMSAFIGFNFGIQGHSLRVIEADGVCHNLKKPLVVSSLQIFAGQRYSFVLQTKTGPPKNYWIAYPATFDDELAFGVLHYQGAPAPDTKTPPTGLQLPDDTTPLEEDKLVPCEPYARASADVQRIDLKFEGHNPGADGVNRSWTINNKQASYGPGVNMTSNTLFEIIRQGRTSQGAFGMEDVIVINKPTVELTLDGEADHPFHLHGHTFEVIQAAGNGGPNTINPPVRDTVNTGPGKGGAPVRIRFNTDNPGPWILHCHKDWHLETGLAVVFAEDPKEQVAGPATIKPSKQWFELCDIYGDLLETHPELG